MASGRTHAAGSVAVSPLAFIAAVELGFGYGYSLIAMASCAFLGILITPDLDQETRSWVENSLMKHRNIVIALFGWVHYGFWYPYAKRIKHRHWLSHAPIIGTVVRMSYFLSVVLFVCYLFFVSGHYSADINKQALTDFGFAVFIGLSLSDATHWLFDVTSSGMKRLRRRIPKIKKRGL